MLPTIIIYLVPVVQIVLPVYLLLRILKKNFSTQAAWLINIVHFSAAIVFLFVIGRWDVIGYELRYWLYGLLLLLAGISFVKVDGKPFFTKEMKWGWGQMLELIFILIITVWAITGFFPEKEPIELSYPLKGDSYYVIQGGETPPVNYHGAFAEPQTYALDIGKINSWGFRAGGLYPERLEEYTVFGDRVYSPAQGTVVQTVDSLADQQPPESSPQTPVGNHIWIKRDSLFIVLAHLKQGSIQVEKGEEISAGQPVARVGNTGNTMEPHLHMHAVTFDSETSLAADSLLYGGKPVPVMINGRFLIRNDIFSATATDLHL